MSTPFYDLNYSRFFNTPSHELDDSISSSIVLNSTRSDSSSPTCPNPSIIEKNKDNDHEQEVEAINYLHQEDENNLQQQQTLIESRQQESTTDQGVKKFYDMGSVKWMSSRMRLMRKMMSSGQTMASSPTNYNSSIPRTHLDSPQSSSDEDNDDHSSSSSLTSNIRVCSDCNTTKTPLWRSGPKGPKSLCNACGIRQRKARRAMAATRGGLLAVKSTPSGRNNEVIKEKISTGQLKNGRRPGRPAMKKKKAIRFDEFSMMSFSKISALHQALFPQEEKEAAILLMALSCGSLVT